MKLKLKMIQVRFAEIFIETTIKHFSQYLSESFFHFAILLASVQLETYLTQRGVWRSITMFMIITVRAMPNWPFYYQYSV